MSVRSRSLRIIRRSRRRRRLEDSRIMLYFSIMLYKLLLLRKGLYETKRIGTTDDSLEKEREKKPTPPPPPHTKLQNA